MTIQERIENKRKELEQATKVDAVLWADYQAREEILARDYRDPWNKNYQHKQKLESELAALETIATDL